MANATKRKPNGTGASSGKSFEQYMFEKNTGGKVGTDEVNNWFTEAATVIKEAEEHTTDYGSDFDAKLKKLLNESATIRSAINYYAKDSKANSELSKQLTALNGALKHYNDLKYQFGSEEAYFNWQRQNKYDSMTLEDLEAEAEESKKETDYDILGRVYGLARNVAVNNKDGVLDLNALSPSNAEYFKYLEKNYGLNLNQSREAVMGDVQKLKDSGNIQNPKDKVSNDILYYDNSGAAVTYDSLRRIKSTDAKIANIENDIETKTAYANLMEYREDIKRCENATAALQAMAEGIAVQEGYQADLDYISQKYGISTDPSDSPQMKKNQIYEIYMQLIGGNYEGMSVNKDVLAAKGYDWEELNYYHDYLEDKEARIKQMQSYNGASQAPVLSTALGIAAAPFQVFDFVGDVVDQFKASGKGEYSAYGLANIYDNDAVYFSQDAFSGVAQGINDSILNATGSETLAWLGSTAYSGATSALQSYTVTATSLALFGPKAGPAIAMGILSSQAASSHYVTAIQNGSTQNKALASAVAAGIAEGFFEKVSMDKLIKTSFKMDTSSFKNFVKSLWHNSGNLALNGVTEASEELATSISNRITDDIINGNYSAYNVAVDKYMRSGMSREEAGRKASLDFGTELIESALGGFFGGITTGGAKTTVDTFSGFVDTIGTEVKEHKDNKAFGKFYNNDTEMVQALIDEALESPEGSDARKLAEELQEKLNSGKKISGKELKNLTKANEKQFRSDDTDKIRTAAEGRLTRLGETSDVSNVASAITKQFVGEELTAEEKTALENSKYGVQVADELSSGNSWAANLETDRINIKANDKTPQIAVDSQYEISDDGETINTKTDEPVTIKNIADVPESGEVNLTLDDGTIVKASDLSFSSAAEAVFIENIGKIKIGKNPITANAANSLYQVAMSALKNQPNMTASEAMALIKGLTESYVYGTYNLGLSKLNSSAFANDLTQNERKFAYDLGHEQSVVKSQAGQKIIDNLREKASPKTIKKGLGKVIIEGSANVDSSTLTPTQKKNLEGIKLLAELSSIEFHVFKSEKKGGKYKFTMPDGTVTGANGWFVAGTNEIWIDLNAGNAGEGAMIRTAAHEISHYIKEKSPAQWKAMADLLMGAFAENNVDTEYMLSRQKDKIKQRYKANKKAIPSEPVLLDMAYEEVVCDALSDMLTDGSIVNFVAEVKAKNRNLAQRILDAINNLLKKWGLIIEDYEGRSLDTPEAEALSKLEDTFKKLQVMFRDAFMDANETVATIGARNLEDLSAAKNTNGEELFQYRAMEADEATYRDMLVKWGKMTNTQVDNLFTTIDRAMDIIKDNLEVLDYAWEADINDRAFSPVKPNSDSLYQVSLDFSTLCRKRILQQTIATHLQEALNQPISREEGIAIRDALIALQEEGRQIEVACALCYVESARMKSPAQIKKFLNSRETVLKEFFAGKSGGSMKAKIKQAEVDAREKLHKENPNGIKGKDGSMLDPRTASLKAMPKKYADPIRDAKRAAKAAYEPTAEEQKLIDVAKGMTVSDFTSPEGLENLAKNYPSLFDAYTSYIRNATKSKGIEGDTWWRAGDSAKIGDVLIANMNRENGLRSQSWSDFQVVHILDYIAATIELSTRNVKEQAYSKVPDYIELMGQTGVMLNMSLIPTAKFNGTLEYDSVEGMAYKKALELREKYPATAGTICIGISNEQIKMLLADGTIDYVIPYHKSGMAASIRKLMHIPTWDQYEDYQSEKELSDADAAKNAEKYGVKLLDKSDPNYHKHTSFSEWFDLDVAKQIAKMENANPTNKAMQKKYGVMYGGYMAMQNAADNYLKLCAERGLSPKFSHKNAGFTAEDNYWKLLIDRKMVNNVTGEIIEQQTIKPIFDEGEVLRILNDELERYPSVKADQEYATRTVVDKFLSGEIKSGMSAEAIAKVMKKPVDNIAKTNILASAEGENSDVSYSERETLEQACDSLETISDEEYLKAKSENPFVLVMDHTPQIVIDSMKEDGAETAPANDRKVLIRRDALYLAIRGSGVQEGHYHELGKEVLKNLPKYLEQPDVILKTNENDRRLVLTHIDAKNGQAIISVEFESIKDFQGDRDYFNVIVTVFDLHQDYLKRLFRKFGAEIKYKKEDLEQLNPQLYKWLRSINSKSSAEDTIPNSEDSVKENSENLFSDRDYVKAGNKAVMTADRIDDLIEDSGAGKRVDYANSWITSISPTDFLNMTTTPAIQDREAFDKYPSEWNDDATMDTYDYLGELKKNGQTPYLSININTGMVVGHEGRHRIRALEREGIKSVEIMVEFKDDDYRIEKYSPDGKRLKIKDAVKIINQFGTNQTATITNVIPLNEDYRSEIFANYGEDLAEDGDILYQDRDYAPAFYSQMGKVVEGVKQEKLAANSVVNMLRGKGVKAEEIRWSGIVPFLEGKKSVTKQELLDFINSSMLQIGEQMSNSEFIDVVKKGNKYVIINKDDGTVLDTFRKIGKDLWENESGDGAESLQEIKDFAIIEYSGARWTNFKLDGGENYREIVFTMPNSSYSNQMMRVHWGEDAEGVLVHARIQDFDVNGKKMLFIEEIQSDYHNEGHKDGYQEEEKLKELQELEAKANEAFLALEDYSTELTGLAGEYEAVAKTQKGRELLRAKIRSEKALKQAQAQIDTKVPDAPFKENYHEFVLKRLLRMAAERGYDSIGWTPSEIQSERWSDEFAEGYRIEYDQEMPKFLRKYGKQWGATVGKTDIAKETVTGRERILKENELRNVKRDIESEKRELARHSDSYEKARIQRSIASMEKTAAALEHELSESLSIWSMDITDLMKNSVLHEGQALFQERDSDSVSNRSLLANSLESAAQNDIERNKLAEYKKKISLIEAEEQKLSEIQKQLFTKGGVEAENRKALQFEAKQIANRINTYDRQLLNLEATTALKNVLNREKEMARKRQKQKDTEYLRNYKEKVAKTQRELLERYQESRKNAVEGRNKTAMRHKIKGVVGELNQLLLKGTKDKHVMIGLQKAVAEALDAVNMDTVGADERVAKYDALIAKAKDPDVIASLTETRDRIQSQGDKMSDKLNALKNAYNEIKNSDDPLIANSYDEVITSRIEAVVEKVGNTPLRDMTLAQLEDVYDMYKMVLTVIRNSNKAFKSAKNESIATLGNRVMMEVEKVGGNHPLSRKALEGIKNFEWNSLKPIYAFRVIGSDTLTDIYNNVRAGEDTWARDVNEARDYYREKTKKYNFDSWDFKKSQSFTSTSGKTFELTLEQIMSLYAYSKREQADLHLQLGGFVFDSSIEVTKKSKLGIPLKYTVKTADAYNLSKETLGNIIETLTAEQKAFVDEMQSYLSTVMGEKGNEVSLEMYGVKLFKEKNYFPLKSAKQFMFEQSESAGEVRIKNSGFSKETVAKANNPIILNNFTDVWTNHVNDMSMYHAFVLALEDFNRVYNYKTPTSDSMATESVKMFLQNAYGNQASQYIKNLITDLNGGVRVDPAADPINKGIAAFKKAAVFASASVVIQQPSAIARATAQIDSKYFVTKLGIKDHGKLWSEVKKYAPVAIIKEMGRFDTHIGQQTTDWIKSTEYKGILQKTKAVFTDSAYRDDLLSRAPALADELAWCYIWNAVKKETKATTNLQVGSEEFLKKCGERFTEIVTLTQVYDSVLSRSAHMRSKDTGMKMATSFMAEPTTAMNMAVDAVIQGKRGNKKFARKAVGAVAASIILNSILVSLVYAARDDDEDETYVEKYIGSLTSELLDGFNPLTYIPFVKDMWSIAQGYDVERSDMSLYSKLWQAVENLFKEDMSAKDKVIDFAGTVANLFGIPLKNITRDAEAMFNLTDNIMGGTQTTGAGILDTVGDALRNSIPLLGRFYEEDSNATKLYKAIISGDEVQIERAKSHFKDDKAIETALRKALRENDPRIIEAAQARIDGDIAKYTKLVKEIKAEGNFEQDTIVAAINAEINAINKGEGTVQTPAEDKEESIYKMDDLFAAVANGDRASANTVRADMIRIDVANGKSQEDAEDSFNSKVTSRCREEYEEGNLTGREAADILVNYGGKTEKEATNKVLYWDFKEDYPDVDMSEEALVKYYDQVESSGISLNVYVDYYEKQKQCKGVDANKDGKTDSGSKKAQILKVINSLPISKSQKDVLYYLNGWSKSTLYEAPWH